MNETLIDQIPILLDLKHFLSHLALRDIPLENKQPLIMETIPEIKSDIMKQCFKKWKKIAKKQIELIFRPKKDLLIEVAKR